MKNEKLRFVDSTKRPIQYNVKKRNAAKAATIGTRIFGAEEINTQTHQQHND